MKYRMDEITESCLGKMLDSKKNKGEYQQYLANINVRWGSFDLNNLSLMRFEPNENDRYGIKYGDLIMCEGGEPGRCAIWRDELPNMKIQKALHRIRPNTNLVDVEYLYYWFLLSGKNDLLRRHFTETTIKHLPGETLKQLVIDLPDMKIQKNISTVLRSIDKKITVNEKINDNLLEQASTLFNSAIQQSTSVVYAELGSLAEVKGGKRLPKGVNLVTTPNQHPYIRVRDLNNTVFASLSNDYEYVDDETQQSISRYTVSTGDLLISIVGTIGLTTIVDHTLNKANLTENCVKLTNIKNVTPEYLLLFLRSLQGVEAISKGTVGAVQLKLPIKNIQSITVPLLCDEELQPLQETLSAIFSQISANIIEMKQLADIRDTLLPKLMSGELDVSAVEL